MTRTARLWVTTLLVLLCVPGVIGFELWPLTGWRLFSLARDGSQTEWALDAVTAGAMKEVDLEQLPLAFRNASWPLAELADASSARRESVCLALLDGVRDVLPDADGLVLVRERRTMHEDRISERREAIHRCEVDR